jgi:hypothetical protein
MPRMTIPFDRQAGAVIEVEFRHPDLPTGQTASVSLLIDIGSSRSCLDQAIAVYPGLPLIAQRTVRTAAGDQLFDQWSADLIIPALAKTFSRLLITDYQGAGINHGGILGRDILSQGKLWLDGPKGEAILEL